MIFDALMIALSCLIFVLFHPGFVFGTTVIKVHSAKKNRKMRRGVTKSMKFLKVKWISAGILKIKRRRSICVFFRNLSGWNALLLFFCFGSFKSQPLLVSICY